MVKRNEGAHANAMDNYALFVAAMVLGTVAGVESSSINAVGLSYSFARLVYGFLYVLGEGLGVSYGRSLAWWWGNLSCLGLLWGARGRL